MLLPLLRRSKYPVTLAMLAGLASGLATAAVIALINRSPGAGAWGWRPFAWFLALAGVIALGRVVAQTLLTHVAQNAATELRLDLGRRILASELRVLEEVGPDRLLTAMVDDVGTITSGLVTIPMLCAQVAVVAGCLAYMAWLSGALALGVGVFIVLGMTSVQLVIRSAIGCFDRARSEENLLFKYLRSLIFGAKELKLHDRRRDAFLTDLLEATSRRYQRHAVRGNAIFSVAVSWGSLLFFIAMGTVLYLVPARGAMDPRVVSGYVITLLYLMVPLDVIGSLLPGIGRTEVALRHLESLRLALPQGTAPAASQVWRKPPTSVALQRATFTYSGRDGRPFAVGPIDLEVRAGELLFVVGGNGSGKTTLTKLLVGLYDADDGRTYCNGEPVTALTRAAFRQQFSVVFSDCHLFEELLGLDGPELAERVPAYLRLLDLDDKVQVREGKLSTLDLSQGQRKRLALLTAYLEDRPIYVFDEWAADQDPAFKTLFYTKLVPELKRRGKAVVVVTHDDRFFHLADRIVKLDEGRIVSDGPPAAADIGPAVPERAAAESRAV
jgi:putative pyoverdin transport system ATP-binding/permease protein